MSQTTKSAHAHPLMGRDLVLQAASQLFFSRGYDGTSISQLARAAGMTKSNIYHHFSNKEALYRAVIEQFALRIAQSLTQAARGDTWRARLINGGLGLARFYKEESIDVMAVLRDLGRIGADDLETWRDEIAPAALAPLVKAIEAGREAGEVVAIDPVWAAWMFMVVVSASTRPLFRARDPDPARQAIELFIRGIEAKDQGD